MRSNLCKLLTNAGAWHTSVALIGSLILRCELARARRFIFFLVGFFALLGGPGYLLAAGDATVVAKAADQKVVTIPVKGMACVACAATVKRTVKALEGVFEVEVNLTPGSVRVTYSPDRLAPDHIVSVINQLGYKAGMPVEVP